MRRCATRRANAALGSISCAACVIRFTRPRAPFLLPETAVKKHEPQIRPSCRMEIATISEDEVVLEGPVSGWSVAGDCLGRARDQTGLAEG
jgi:hypothetical protein